MRYLIYHRRLIKATFALILLISFNAKAQTTINDSAINFKMYKAQQYLTGTGEPKNETTAFQLYLQCALMSKPQAMNMVGVMYKKGIGVIANKEKAIEWFTKAGNVGYANG